MVLFIWIAQPTTQLERTIETPWHMISLLIKIAWEKTNLSLLTRKRNKQPSLMKSRMYMVVFAIGRRDLISISLSFAQIRFHLLELLSSGGSTSQQRASSIWNLQILWKMGGLRERRNWVVASLLFPFLLTHWLTSRQLSLCSFFSSAWMS